jgi:hypothetical protein
VPWDLLVIIGNYAFDSFPGGTLLVIRLKIEGVTNIAYVTDPAYISAYIGLFSVSVYSYCLHNAHIPVSLHSFVMS